MSANRCYETSGPFILVMRDRPAGPYCVEHADGQKSVLTECFADAQKFETHEEAEAAKREIPVSLTVEVAA